MSQSLPDVEKDIDAHVGLYRQMGPFMITTSSNHEQLQVLGASGTEEWFALVHDSIEKEALTDTDDSEYPPTEIQDFMSFDTGKKITTMLCLMAEAGKREYMRQFV